MWGLEAVVTYPRIQHLYECNRWQHKPIIRKNIWLCAN